MDPREARELIKEEIEEGLTFIAGGYRFDQIPDVFEKLSANFQATGICYLLEKADQETFRVNLVRSGHARRFYLKKAREEGDASDRLLALSRTEAFFDAVVAGHLTLAKEIADLSPNTWLAAREYEDDFCYFLILHELVRGREPAAIRPLLARLEGCLEGATSFRLNACRALVERDAGAFEDALRRVIAQRQEALEEERPQIPESDYLFWPRSFVFIEGLALLKIAALLNVKPETALPLCPDVALLPMHEPVDRDFFEELDQNVRLAGGYRDR